MPPIQKKQRHQRRLYHKVPLVDDTFSKTKTGRKAFRSALNGGERKHQVSQK
jgi:hypothetical protein